MDWSLPATMIRSGASAAPPEGAPHEQDDDRPDHSDHDALDVDPGDVTLVEHRLGEVPAHDCPDDAKDDRPDQPLASADEEVRQKPCDGTEHDPTDDAHGVPPAPACRPRCGCCGTPPSLRSHVELPRASGGSGEQPSRGEERLSFSGTSGKPSNIRLRPPASLWSAPSRLLPAEGRAATGGRFGLGGPAPSLLIEVA